MSGKGDDRAKAWRVPTDLQPALDEIATVTGGEPQRVVRQALEQYLAGDGAAALAAAKGDAEFTRGDSQDFDDVLTEMEAIIRGRAA